MRSELQVNDAVAQRLDSGQLRILSRRNKQASELPEMLNPAASDDEQPPQQALEQSPPQSDQQQQAGGESTEQLCTRLQATMLRELAWQLHRWLGVPPGVDLLPDSDREALVREWDQIVTAPADFKLETRLAACGLALPRLLEYAQADMALLRLLQEVEPQRRKLRADPLFAATMKRQLDALDAALEVVELPETLAAGVSRAAVAHTASALPAEPPAVLPQEQRSAPSQPAEMRRQQQQQQQQQQQRRRRQPALTAEQMGPAARPLAPHKRTRNWLPLQFQKKPR